MINSIRLFLVCLFCFTLLSCDNDDDSNVSMDTHPIVGDWLRSDFTEEPLNEFRLIFQDNNEGFRIFLTTTLNGDIGTTTDFNWSISNDILTISDIENETIVTSFEFTASGNLLLPDYSDLEFIRQ
ncbi:lipocalin family protein [Olleya sp. YS]|uniref:lipocalin family protein n=1 Tax=Olleya sp. YS TaxID=3028318 RepID=UPI002434281D|nr:lipocalin family protein [Olleya sp. YS]WGD34281.1 lipocalin family protein [Olleya sp. YS]